MEARGSKELIKSTLIMAGIPLAFSVACTIIARIKHRKISSFQDRINETEFNSMCDQDEDCIDVNHLKEQIYSLRSKIEELQDLEKEIKVRFFRFIDLKDQEYALMEIQKSLCLEKERVEFMEREMSLMEVENKKFDEMMVEYIKTLGELESSRLENGLLRRRENKLLKKTRESSKLVKKQNLKIEAREAEMLRSDAELKRKEILIGGYEVEVMEMRGVISKLRDEKNEVVIKLDVTEKELALKAEEERKLMEKYNQVVNELESLQKDRAAELKELIYLRWCHACLRHELARRNEVEQQTRPNDIKNDHEVEMGENVAQGDCIGQELNNEIVLRREEPFFGSNQRNTKKGWLIKKFKKWVEGNEKHHDTKCFGSQSVVDEGEEQHAAARKSFSSV
ncbi:protein CHUP1, chloroplastic [Rutidosis leptorrhynchoides]|uniref:protein CHUP1, chloroplastic n=1 Tax=Rutidosis leptorrhynchoides TaxID=125765 RepID=UPI003A999993